MIKTLLIFADSDKPRGKYIASLVFIPLLMSVPAYSFQNVGINPVPEATDIKKTITLDIAGQINPEGLRVKTGGFKRWIKGIDDDGQPSRYLQAGLGLSVTPAYTMASIYGEWQPAVFLNLHVEYDLTGYFGAYTGLLSFPDKYARFGDDELDELDGQEETATGHRLSLQPTLYAKAGPVIIMNKTDLAYYRFNGHGPYFLELKYDTLLKDGDYLADNSTSLLVNVLRHRERSFLYLGPYYNVTRAHDSGIKRQCAGAQMYWILDEHRWGIKSPRIYSQSSFIIEDRNRKGEISLAVGFGADFDL